ncbi:outer envelope protein 61-like [Chenopodium quinoa]|uniref:outer envelope protein 61-like n=1 Tax=Chenopodium quinoa TaxID=63459 RepID=UPI000B794EB8|nr:outer envelope protein 61-like [Chenopodium quinoa]
MFNGMMDPELFRIAQEQMSRMSPAEMAKIQQQMMSNPELLKMASEGMKNMRPEDLKMAAEQMKNVRPEEMAQIGEKMANSSPEEIASMRARADAQLAYELNAAELLKKQGNDLHKQGKYHDAAQKYLRAKNNLQGAPVARSRALQLACSLNLMSCYLKTRQFNDCIKEGSEVLAYDEKNVKALYRRGQAYKELGQLEVAASDLTRALEVTPGDDTIAEVLREVNESLGKEGVTRTSTGLVIEEITEEVEAVLVSNDKRASQDCSVTHPEESIGHSKYQSETVSKRPTTESECLQAMKDDPDTIRSFQNFISETDPEVLARMNMGNNGEVPADMLKTASNMIGRMSPEELQNMMKMASSFKGDNSPFNGNFGPGSVPPNLSPEMLKTASDMMGKMSPEEIQRMFEMASSLKQDSVPSSSGSSSGRSSSESGSKFTANRDVPVDRNNSIGERNSISGSYTNFGSTSQSSMPTSMSDMQEQMRNQMKDPAMRQMFSSMMKNMSPDMMASMSEQFGLKLSKEDAAKAQEAMSSLSPEDLDKMMRWADRIQRGVEGAKKTKNWLLGRPGMIIAVCMLLLAVILHFFGFIGR